MLLEITRPTRVLHITDLHEDYIALSIALEHAIDAQVDLIALTGDMLEKPYTKASRDRLLFQAQLAQTRYADTPSTMRQALHGHIERFKEEMNGTSTRKLGMVQNALEATGIQYVVVPGNYDRLSVTQEVFGDNNRHMKTGETLGRTSFGYGGGNANPQHITFLEQLGLKNEFNPITGLFELKARGVTSLDWLFLHNPPHGLCDRTRGQHVGDRTLRALVEQYTPKMVLCGHIHGDGPDTPEESGEEFDQTRGVKVIQKAGKHIVVVNSGNIGRADSIDSETLATMIHEGRPATHRHGTYSIITLDNNGAPKIVDQYSIRIPGGVGFLTSPRKTNSINIEDLL